jgi:hypothetical protein
MRGGREEKGRSGAWLWRWSYERSVKFCFGEGEEPAICFFPPSHGLTSVRWDSSTSIDQPCFVSMVGGAVFDLCFEGSDCAGGSWCLGRAGVVPLCSFVVVRV